MLENSDLIEFFNLQHNDEDQNEVIEHYGRKGMRWGQRIFSGVKSVNKGIRNRTRPFRRKARKILDDSKKASELRKQYRDVQKAKKHWDKGRDERFRQHIKEVDRLTKDLGTMSAEDVKKLATRLENEAKIINNAKKLQAEMPPSKIKKAYDTINKVGDTKLPVRKYDKKGNVEGVELKSIKNIAKDKFMDYANEYVKERYGVDIQNTAEKASSAKDKAETIYNTYEKIYDNVQETKRKRSRKSEPEFVRPTRIRRRENTHEPTYEFYPNTQLLLE